MLEKKMFKTEFLMEGAKLTFHSIFELEAGWIVKVDVRVTMYLITLLLQRSLMLLIINFICLFEPQNYLTCIF